MADLVTSLNIKQPNGDDAKQDIGVEIKNVIGLDEVLDIVVEEGENSTHDYDRGDQFLWKGKLYEAVIPIGINDAFVVEGAEKNIKIANKVGDTFVGASKEKEGNKGMVPTPNAGDQDKFLKADGTWDDVPNPQIMQGATSEEHGIEGLVPAPDGGDEDRVLQGNGSWGKKLQLDIVIQNGQYGYINKEGEFVSFKSQADIDSAISDAMQGTAEDIDVLEGTTFTNKNGKGIQGAMPHLNSNNSNSYYCLHNEPQTPYDFGNLLSIDNNVLFTQEDKNLYKANGNFPELTSDKCVTFKFNKGRGFLSGEDRIGIPYKWFGTAASGHVLAGNSFTSQNGIKINGTMFNNGAVAPSGLNCGGSYTIPAGYHNGSGKVIANSLASQTSANASAGQILVNKTAWVNGSKITGTMSDRGAWKSTINAGGSVTIPAGYHNGSGKVTANNKTSFNITLTVDNYSGNILVTKPDKSNVEIQKGKSITLTVQEGKTYSLTDSFMSI